MKAYLNAAPNKTYIYFDHSVLIINPKSKKVTAAYISTNEKSAVMHMLAKHHLQYQYPKQIKFKSYLNILNFNNLDQLHRKAWFVIKVKFRENANKTYYFKADHFYKKGTTIKVLTHDHDPRHKYQLRKSRAVVESSIPLSKYFEHSKVCNQNGEPLIDFSQLMPVLGYVNKEGR